MTMEDMKYSQTNVLTKQIIIAWRFCQAIILAANQHSYLTEPCKVISYSTLRNRVFLNKTLNFISIFDLIIFWIYIIIHLPKNVI